MKGQFDSGKFRYSREYSDFFSETEKMDTVIKEILKNLQVADGNSARSPVDPHVHSLKIPGDPARESV